jgi:hypothetical protein
LAAATDDHPIKSVIEIGTLYGGFTQLLRDHDVSKCAQLFSFNVKKQCALTIKNATLIIGDVFGSVHNQIIDLIKSQDRVALFCDGGDKEREINEFSAFLKPKDLILCHDYVKDPSLVGKAETGYDWPCYESLWANVKNSLEKNNCTPFLETEMQLAMWGCFIKN